jgi:peroxiredoxin
MSSSTGTGALLPQLLFIAAAASLVYSFVAAAKDGETRRTCAPLCSLGPDYAGLNRTIPDFELPDLDGKPVKISDFRGRVVILNLWTKTCRPCLEEMPSLADLAKVLERHPEIQLLTITTDESAEDARDTLRSVLGANVRLATLVDSQSKVVRELLGTRLFPETWFIDPNGVIRARIDGPRDWRALTPLTLDFAKSIQGPLACEVEFDRRVPQGNACQDIPFAG